MQLPSKGAPVQVIVARRRGAQIIVLRARVERIFIAANTEHGDVAFATNVRDEQMRPIFRDDEGVTWCRGWDPAAAIALEAAWRLDPRRLSPLPPLPPGQGRTLP